MGAAKPGLPEDLPPIRSLKSPGKHTPLDMNTHFPADNYYPPPESQGGWRFCHSPKEVRDLAGLDARRLQQVGESQMLLYGGDSWSIVVIRHGYLAWEFHTFNILFPTRFDIFSGTKSFTGTAWGMLLEDCREGLYQGFELLNLESPAYALIPESYPLSDPRKEAITLQHLLSMTSGIPGEDHGLIGMPTATGVGPFEYALGKAPNRYGRWADRLVSDPGKSWDYSDAAIAHLSLLFSKVAGREMADYMQERVFSPIGIESLSWDIQGGSGSLGPHTNAHTGIHISARELARFGYLTARNGSWQGQQLIPAWWNQIATSSSQTINPCYGFTWWVNTNGTQWPGVPGDAFALAGYRSNRCFVIPSLDLVVARVGTGPVGWDEQDFIRQITKAVDR